MLNLAASTDPAWLDRARAHLDDVLLDHAHCEKKAASTALGLIFRYPHHGCLVIPLSRLAREELAHFEEVLGHLRRRGIPFRRQRPSEYAAPLMALIRDREPDCLLDTLLCCCLIEARSCERLRLLAEALDAVDSELAAFYRGLVASEARHHQMYVELAHRLELWDADVIRNRLEHLAEAESDILRRSPDAPRLHHRP